MDFPDCTLDAQMLKTQALVNSSADGVQKKEEYSITDMI
mgnify:CR=1 FL=1